MKRTCLILAAIMCFLTARANATYVFFKVADTPAEGLDKLVYHTTVQVYPQAKGYYWADQAGFVHGGHAIYIGLQPRDKADEYMAIFSVFGKGPRGLSEHTSNGADGGAGSSGSIHYPWVKDHRYALEIKMITSDQTHADETAWQGSVTDETTKQTTIIATFAVPQAWGHLSPRSTFFSEYFIYNAAKYHGDHPAPRPEQPYAKVLAEAPEASADGKNFEATISGLKPNNPDNEKLEKVDDKSATVETGLSAKAKAAS